MFKKLFLLTIVFSFFFLGQNAFANTEFDPNFLISDQQLLDYSSMSVQDIQNFLASKGSYLAYFKTFDAHYQIKSAAEIIYNAATHNYDCENTGLSSRASLAEKEKKCKIITTVNPKFLLVLLQKEQGLIENKNPEFGRLLWATGYGCPDGRACNRRWEGFGKQVNSAALQFKDYMENPQDYKYQVGKTYVFRNPYSSSIKAATTVTPANQATAALYNYTPHVYNGNYNFWVIWNRYFKSALYPNGSLLQAKGEPGVWLIQNGKKRPFASKTALTSRFDINKIIQVDPALLAKFEKGTPIRFPQYSIIQDPDNNLWLLVDNKRRKFVDMKAFRKIGYNPEEIMKASWEDVNSYQEGKEITENEIYPTGALLQNKQTGGIYWVEEGTKAPILEKIFLEAKFKGRKIIVVSPDELAQYKTVEPVKFSDGDLIRIKNAPGVYVVADGQLKAIKSNKIFESMGYKWKNVIDISPQVFMLYIKDQPIGVLGEE